MERKTDPKKLERNRRYREAHRDELRQKNREYYWANREKRLASKKASVERHKEAVLARNAEHSKKWRLSARQKIIMALGGKCAWCGFDDWRALQVDHINGGGTTERRKRNSTRAYLEDIANGNSAKYQLLCANCNQIKRYEAGEVRRRS